MSDMRHSALRRRYIWKKESLLFISHLLSCLNKKYTFHRRFMKRWHSFLRFLCVCVDWFRSYIEVIKKKELFFNELVNAALLARRHVHNNNDDQKWFKNMQIYIFTKKKTKWRSLYWCAVANSLQFWLICE